MTKTLRHEERPVTKATLIVALAALIMIGTLGFLMWDFGRSETSASYEPVPEPQQVTLAEARELAEEAAQEWNQGAVPVQLIPINEEGSNVRFRAVYAGVSNTGVALAVIVYIDGNIETEEMVFTGEGATLPVNGKTESEAIAEVRAMPGRENVEILSVEARFDSVNKVWYWGVRTDKGTISVKMEK